MWAHISQSNSKWNEENNMKRQTLNLAVCQFYSMSDKNHFKVKQMQIYKMHLISRKMKSSAWRMHTSVLLKCLKIAALYIPVDIIESN